MGYVIGLHVQFRLKQFYVRTTQVLYQYRGYSELEIVHLFFSMCP